MAHSVPPAPPLPPIETSRGIRFFISSSGSREKGLNDSSLYDLSLFYSVAISRVKHVPQTGPNCGLAALAMVATLTPKKLSLIDIFNEAKSKQYTNNGEMFSVENMKNLAETILSPWFGVEMFSGGLSNHKSLAVERLYNCDLMLIPYDADKDHRPCCVGGHKAHWALVCGVMQTASGEVHVAAQHGKSRHLAVWSLESLCLSNDNLAELDPARATDGLNYRLPPGGLSGGLASKFILLHKTS